MKLNLFFLIGWIALAFTLCLMPGPHYWEARLEEHGHWFDTGCSAGDGGAVEHPRGMAGSDSAPSEPGAKSPVLGSFLSEHVKTKERLGHFVPMVGIAFCLWRLLVFARFGVMKRVLMVMSLVLLLALLIEVLQSLLPDWFSRGFAVDDILVGLAGGLCGLVLGGSVERRCRQLRFKTASL